MSPTRQNTLLQRLRPTPTRHVTDSVVGGGGAVRKAFFHVSENVKNNFFHQKPKKVRQKLAISRKLPNF